MKYDTMSITKQYQKNISAFIHSIAEDKSDYTRMKKAWSKDMKEKFGFALESFASDSFPVKTEKKTEKAEKKTKKAEKKTKKPEKTKTGKTRPRGRTPVDKETGIPMSWDSDIGAWVKGGSSRPYFESREEAQSHAEKSAEKTSCQHKFNRGPRKGKKCGKKAGESDYCTYHAGAHVESTDSESSDESDSESTDAYDSESTDAYDSESTDAYDSESSDESDSE